jgi:hypothetical protein
MEIFMRSLITNTLVSLSLAAIAVPLAIAQPADSAAGAPQGRHSSQPHHEKRAFSLPSERVEARLAYLKTALKITAAQQTQWDAYAGEVRKEAGEMDQRVQAWRSHMTQGPRDHAPTAIERIERTQARLAAVLQRLNERLAVEKPLYAALTPDQKLVADEILAPRHQGMSRGNGKRWS